MLNKSLIAITVAGVLAGTALITLAGNAKGKAFEGVTVNDIVVVEQFPAEVQIGSIQLKDDNEQAMATKAKLSSKDAAEIARRALPGKVVETRLSGENGYLIWEVEAVGDKGQEAHLKIDAGNSRLLAIEAGEDGEHQDGDCEDRDGEQHSN